MKVRAITGLAFLISVMIGGCQNHADLDPNGVPEKLLVGMYGGDNPGQTKEALAPMRAYLEKKLGMKVEFFFTTDYTTEIEALRAKKIHMAILGPFAYILAAQKPGLEPIATLGLDGKPALYRSAIFTTPKTGLKTMDDVKARSKSLTLCFADPASTSGHLIPRAYLTSIGLNPQNAFKEAVFAGSHAASILSVKSGKMDIGCSTIDLGINKLIREGLAKRSDFVILWTSPPIINDVTTIRVDLNKDFIKKVQDAFLQMATDNYQAFNAYVKLYYPDTHRMSYVTVQDSQFNSLRKIAGNLDDLKLNK